MKPSNYLALAYLSTGLSACNPSTPINQAGLLNPATHSSSTKCSNTTHTECQTELVRAPIPAKIRKILSPETTESKVLFPGDIIAFDWRPPHHSWHQTSNQQYTITVALSESSGTEKTTLFSRACPPAQQTPAANNQATAPRVQPKCSERYLVQCIYMPNNQNQLLCETRTPSLESQSAHWMLNLGDMIRSIPQTMHLLFKTCTNNSTICKHQSVPIQLH